ncbi:calcium/proton exchanger [Ceratobasidium sp. AG-Ba]|nr:calcium/proton exchanger [Ceratobasidium sp. AG-Ba]
MAVPLQLVDSTSGPDMYRTTSTAPLFAQRRPTAPPTGWWSSLWWRLQGGGRPVPGIWDSCVAIATSSWLNVLLVNVPLAWTAALMKLNPLLVFGLLFLLSYPSRKCPSLLVTSLRFTAAKRWAFCQNHPGQRGRGQSGHVFAVRMPTSPCAIDRVILLHALFVPGISFLTGASFSRSRDPARSSRLFLRLSEPYPPGCRQYQPDIISQRIGLGPHFPFCPCYPTPPPSLHFVPDPISPPNHKSLGVRDHKRRAAAIAIDQDANLESTDGVRERNPERADEEYMLESARTVAVSDDTRQAVETFSRGYAVMLMIIYILSRVYLHRHPLNDDLRLNRQSDIECYEPEKAIPTDTHKRKPRRLGYCGLLLPQGLESRSLPPGQSDGLEEPDELAEGRSIDLSIQFLLFWLPLLVIIAWITRKPLTSCLIFEVASAIGACLLVNYATQDGKTNWVEGIILVVFYVMIALAAWFYNGQLAVFELLQCQSIDDIVKTNSVLGSKVGI